MTCRSLSSNPPNRSLRAMCLLLAMCGVSVSVVAQAPETEIARASAQAPTPADNRDWREILPGLAIGSQLRFRTETRRNFRFDDSLPGNDEDFVLSRFRFDFTWQPTDYLVGVIELQDARIYGETGISEDRTPNIFADQLDVHQAYLDARSPSSSNMPLSLRIGRQKISLGAQRLVSPLEWVNTARVFDGARFGIGTGTGRSLEAFLTRLVPVTPDRFNDHTFTASRLFNSQFHGIYYTDTHLLPSTTVEAYWLLRREGAVDDEIYTVGTRVDATFGGWAIDGEAARQLGTFGGIDQRSAMLHVGGSFTTTLPATPKIGAAFNLGQGDDNPNDGVHRTFDNLYPLNHAFYGYMDLFALQNLRNVEVSLQAVLPHDTRVRVAYQHFTLPEPGTDFWYNAGAGQVHRADNPAISSSVGSEVDVTVRVPLWEVGLEAGYGHFFGGDYLDDAAFALRSADFLYLQTVVGF